LRSVSSPSKYSYTCRYPLTKRLTATICLTIAVLLGSAGAVYALPPYPSDQNRYYDNCFGTYTHANGDKYAGEYRNNKKHGQGTYAYGRIKEGMRKDGSFQYSQKVTPPVVASKPPSCAPRKRADPDKVVAAASGSGCGGTRC